MPTKEMTLDDLIDRYQVCLEESQTEEEDADEWLVELAEIGEQLVGRKVTATVNWQSGKTTVSSGVVDSIRGNKVYFQTMLGLVEGEADTMESAE